MANTAITMQNIARELLPLLKENLVMPMTVNVDYSDDFVGQGDTIQVEKPAVFVADEFGGSINLQDVTEKSVSVKMDTIADVSFAFTAKEKALTMTQFREKYLGSAARAIAEKVNQDGLALYADIPYYTGVSGTTPDGLEDFANAGKVLNDNKAPIGMRYGAWDTSATAKFQTLDALVNADKSGTTRALREGAIGNVFGFENHMTQAIKTHTAGTFAAVATPLTDGVTAAGATSIVMDGGAGTETILVGDIFTIGTQQYVATANATASGGEVTVPVYPEVPEEIADGTAVVFPDKTAHAHVANLAYQRDAFIFVNRPLDDPSGTGANSYVVRDPESGLSLRVTEAYDISSKKTTMSIDFLYEYVTAYPELATRVLG